MTLSYALIKDLHFTAISLFLLGMCVALVLLAIYGPRSFDDRARVLSRFRAVPFRLVGLALVFAWGFGVWMIVKGGWISWGWLQAKLVLVLLISGLYEMVSAQLRRAASEEDYQPPAGLRKLSLMVLVFVGLVLAILYLVFAKPF